MNGMTFPSKGEDKNLTFSRDEATIFDAVFSSKTGAQRFAKYHRLGSPEAESRGSQQVYVAEFDASLNSENARLRIVINKLRCYIAGRYIEVFNETYLLPSNIEKSDEIGVITITAKAKPSDGVTISFNSTEKEPYVLVGQVKDGLSINDGPRYLSEAEADKNLIIGKIIIYWSKKDTEPIKCYNATDGKLFKINDVSNFDEAYSVVLRQAQSFASHGGTNVDINYAEQLYLDGSNSLIGNRKTNGIIASVNNLNGVINPPNIPPKEVRPLNWKGSSYSVNYLGGVVDLKGQKELDVAKFYGIVKKAFNISSADWDNTQILTTVLAIQEPTRTEGTGLYKIALDVNYDDGFTYDDYASKDNIYIQQSTGFSNNGKLVPPTSRGWVSPDFKFSYIIGDSDRSDVNKIHRILSQYDSSIRLMPIRYSDVKVTIDNVTYYNVDDAIEKIKKGNGLNFSFHDIAFYNPWDNRVKQVIKADITVTGPDVYFEVTGEQGLIDTWTDKRTETLSCVIPIPYLQYFNEYDSSEKKLKSKTMKDETEFKQALSEAGYSEKEWLELFIKPHVATQPIGRTILKNEDRLWNTLVRFAKVTSNIQKNYWTFIGVFTTPSQSKDLLQ